VAIKVVVLAKDLTRIGDAVRGIDGVRMSIALDFPEEIVDSAEAAAAQDKMEDAIAEQHDPPVLLCVRDHRIPVDVERYDAVFVVGNVVSIKGAIDIPLRGGGDFGEPSSMGEIAGAIRLLVAQSSSSA